MVKGSYLLHMEINALFLIHFNLCNQDVTVSTKVKYHQDSNHLGKLMRRTY